MAAGRAQPSTGALHRGALERGTHHGGAAVFSTSLATSLARERLGNHFKISENAEILSENAGIWEFKPGEAWFQAPTVGSGAQK